MKTAPAPVRRRKSQSVSAEGRAAIKLADAYCHMHGRLLIALRLHTGLSHAEIATLARISPATVRTHESGSYSARLPDSMRICAALGFDPVTVMYEVERRLDEAGFEIVPGQPFHSERAFIKMRCSPPVIVPAAEVRRQLRIMRQLTLPRRPGPPNRKRPTAAKTSSR